jgi:hypothetical protein
MWIGANEEAAREQILGGFLSLLFISVCVPKDIKSLSKSFTHSG